jgi:hypothetical protein
MSFFLCGLVVLGVIWFFSSMKSQEKAASAFSAFDEAESWFRENQINLDSVNFAAYEQSELAINYGATILAGTGKKINGDKIGFVIEVIIGRGVVLGEFIEPYGVATWHKNASMQAKIAGKPLVEVLQAMAKAHKAKYTNEE